MYEIPTPEELKKFMADNNLTGGDIAALTGVSPRAARRWVAPVSQKGSRTIPWAAWAMILLLTGKKSIDYFLKLVDKWKKKEAERGLFERGVAGRPQKEGKK
jgi:hypothetical protein